MVRYGERLAEADNRTAWRDVASLFAGGIAIVDMLRRDNAAELPVTNRTAAAHALNQKAQPYG